MSAFVSARIDSVHTLEVLLLLWRTDSRSWTFSDILGEIQSSAGAVEQSLSQLITHGLVVRSDANHTVYRYSPQNAALDRVTHTLARAFAESRTMVIELIYSGPAGTVDHPKASGTTAKAAGARST